MPARQDALRVGLIGCGEVTAEKHLPALAELPDVEVVAAADTDADRLRHVEGLGIRHRYGDLAGFLAHPGLEAVGVCVPPPSQIQVALAALEAGKHVLIEQPLGLSLEACDRFIVMARNSPQKVMAGFHMRWHRLVRQARDVVRSGALGPLQTIRAIWNSPRDDLTLPVWRRRRALGGGALVESAAHHFDLWRFLLGTEVDEVFAITQDGQWEDEAAVVTARLANGILASAVFSERTSHDLEIEICGKAGRLRVACIRFEGLEYYSTDTMPSGAGARLGRLTHFLKELPRGLARMHRAGNYRASYRDEWRHFRKCIRNDAPMESTLLDGRRALEVVLAALESTTRRQPVAVRRPPGNDA